MPKYSISAPYWDGQQYHKTGAVVEFAEGEAPPRSKLVKETEPQAEPKPSAKASAK